MRRVRWCLAASFIAVGGFLMLSSSPSTAAPTCTKTLVTTGAWTTAANWAPAAVPTATDYVCIPDGLTATLGASRTVDGVRILGTLTGAGTLTVSDTGVASPSELSGTVTNTPLKVSVGSLTVDTATMSGSGTTTIASGASMTVKNGDYAYGLLLQDSRSLVNNGTLTLDEQAGTPYASLLLNASTTTVTNNATLDLTGGADIIGNGLLHVPAGGLLRSTTAGTSSTVEVATDLAGRIEPTAGTLTVQQLSAPAAGATTGVVSTAGGSLLLDSLTIAAGSTISTEGAAVTLQGEATGAGQLRVATGTLTVDTAMMSGSGTTTIASGASMTVKNGDYAYGLLLQDSRSLVNNGTLTLDEQAGTPYASLLLNASTTTVTNNATLNLRGGADIAGNGTLTNTTTGTLTKTTTTNQSDVTTVVESDGVVASSVGTLSVNGGGTPGSSTGSFTAAADARTEVGGLVLGDGAQLSGPTAAGSGVVDIVGGDVTVPAAATVTATGRTALDGAVAGAGDLRIASGALALDTATMSGSGTTTIASGASMTVKNGDYAYGLLLQDSRSLVNNGTLTLDEQAGTPYASLLLNASTTTVTNNATLDLTGGADIIGNGLLHVPAGGLLRSTTAGTSSTVEVATDLAGRIEPTAGTLTVQQLSAPAAGATTGVVSTAGGSLLLDSLTIAAGSTISTEGAAVTLQGEATGAGQLRVATGTLTVDTAMMSGSGTTTIASGASMTVKNGDYAYGLLLQDSRSLVNNGTLTLDEQAGTPYASLLLNASTTTVTNNATLNLRGGADIAGNGTLTNATTGTLTKTTTTNQSDVTATTDNSGTVRAVTGLLNISGGFPALSGTTLTRGTYEMLSPGKIRLPGDVTRNDATILLDGTAAALQDSASLTNGLGNLTRVGPTGSLTVRNGRVQPVGALTQQGSVVVGSGAGSKLSAPSYTQTGGSTSLRSADSTLAVTNATSVSGGVLRGLGTLSTGSTGLGVTGTGTLEPGLSGPGTLSVTGNLTLGSTSTLAVDVNGTGAASADRVAVTGTAVTGGKIDITTGFAPALGDTATMLTSGGARTGAFSSATGADLPGDISWAADYTSSSFALRAARPSLSIADASVSEGDTGTKNLTFTLTQSERLLTAASTTVTTVDGSATAGGPAYGGSDYDSVSGASTIAAGDTSTTVSVAVRGDTVYEHDDSFTVKLSAPDNLTLATSSAVGTILNDEAVPTLTVADLSVVEKDPGGTQATAAVKATLSGPSAFTTSAGWATSDGTATSADYTAKSGTVSFAPGSLSKTLSVPVTGDLATEDDETFSVGLSGPAPAGDVTTGGPATVTIRDDDAAVSVSPATGQEPPTGTASLTTTLTLSHANPRSVTLSWATADGSATAPGDYVAVAPTAVTIPAGSTTKTLPMTINSDAVVEPEETFNVNLSSVTGGQPGTITAAITIIPDRCTVVGTSGADTLVGTPDKKDVICGLGGNDVIKPGPANNSGLGNDEVYGGYPGSTADGTDTLNYTDLTCGVEVDLRNHYAEDPAGTTCIGPGRTEVRGIENVTGGSGKDTLRGDQYNNVLTGNAGNDMLLGDAGGDKLYGGAGVDAASYVRGVAGVVGPFDTPDSANVTDPAGTRAAGVVIDLAITVAQDTDGGGLDLLSSIENVFGTTAGDILLGSAAANELSGLEGDDSIDGRAGADKLYGLAGRDVLHGGDGVDFVFGGDGNDDQVWGDGGVEGVTHLSGGDGTGDYCGQESDTTGGTVAGPGCEN